MELAAVIVLLVASGLVAARVRRPTANRARVIATRRQELRRVAVALAVAALALWGYGVYTIINGATERGVVIAAIGAWVLLMLAWARGALWLPDGGGMP